MDRYQQPALHGSEYSSATQPAEFNKNKANYASTEKTGVHSHRPTGHPRLLSSYGVNGVNWGAAYFNMMPSMWPYDCGQLDKAACPTGIRESAILNAADTIMLTETGVSPAPNNFNSMQLNSANYIDCVCKLYPGDSRYYSLMEPRHFDGYNFMFADGHANSRLAQWQPHAP